MKNFILLSIGLFLFGAVGYSQVQEGPDRQKEREARLESMKIAYITEQLELTPEEAQKFWPVYNQYSKEMKSLREQERNLHPSNIESEEAALEWLNANMRREEQMYDLRARYAKDMLGVLPALKVVKLFDAERKFKREVLDQFRRRMEKGKMQKRRN